MLTLPFDRNSQMVSSSKRTAKVGLYDLGPLLVIYAYDGGLRGIVPDGHFYTV